MYHINSLPCSRDEMSARHAPVKPVRSLFPAKQNQRHNQTRGKRQPTSSPRPGGRPHVPSRGEVGGGDEAFIRPTANGNNKNSMEHAIMTVRPKERTAIQNS